MNITRLDNLGRCAVRLASITLVTLIALFTVGCFPAGGGSGSSIFSPPPGVYSGDQLVYINIPEADQIFYTLDGSQPAENCLEYTGSPILVNQLTQIRVMYIDGGVEHQVAEDGTFNILGGTGGGGGAGTETNRPMLLDWIDQEFVIAQLLQKHNNCGQEPNGGGCDDGDFGVDGLNRTWWICDNYDPVSGTGYTDGSFISHRNAPNGSLTACETEGYGWATWRTTADGKATFKYSNFTLTQDLVDSLGAITLPSSAGSATVGTIGMSVTGSIVGSYGIDGLGNGTTRTVAFDHFGDGTDLSPHLKVSGSYTGHIEDIITMVLKQKGGGTYSVYCEGDVNCEPVPVIYVAPNWDRFVAASSSCQAPWFRIETQKTNNEMCLQAPETAGFLQLTTCAGAEEDRQKWVFEDATPNDSGDNVWVARSVANPANCITEWKDPGDLLEVNPYWFKVLACDAALNDPTQHLNITGTNRNVKIKMNGFNRCAENFWSPLNRLNSRTCSSGGGLDNVQYHAFYKEGLHPPEVNPLQYLQSQ